MLIVYTLNVTSQSTESVFGNFVVCKHKRPLLVMMSICLQDCLYASVSL
jgi:hypothetical protein